MSNILCSSTVGSLMYAMVCTQLDIAHAVGVLRKYMSNLGMEHWSVVKWIHRYLRGTTMKVLCFIGSSSALCGFFDSDLAGDVDTRRVL